MDKRWPCKQPEPLKTGLLMRRCLVVTCSSPERWAPPPSRPVAPQRTANESLALAPSFGLRVRPIEAVSQVIVSAARYAVLDERFFGLDFAGGVAGFRPRPFATAVLRRSALVVSATIG